MTRDLQDCLEDIKKYSQHITRRIEGVSKDIFMNDFGMQCELIRCVEVIGEANLIRETRRDYRCELFNNQ